MTSQKSKKRGWSVLAGASVAALIVAAPAAALAAEGAILVSPSNLSGWTSAEDSAVAEFIPVAGAPLGLGALHLSTPGNDDFGGYIYELSESEQRLAADLKASYASIRLAGAAHAAPGFFIWIDRDGDLSTTNDQFRAIWEPAYNGGSNYDQWNTWTIDQNSVFWFTGNRPNPGSFTRTLAAELGDTNPNATIFRYRISQGDGNTGWETMADAVSFAIGNGEGTSELLFDFDPDPVVPPAPEPEPGLPATGSAAPSAGVAIGALAVAGLGIAGLVIGLRRSRA